MGSEMCIRDSPQTGLALMGFSRYCPSSLDLTNFVVWSHRGECSGYLWLTALNLEIWESGNPGIWKSGIHKIPKMNVLRMQNRTAQNVSKVLISRNRNLPAPFGAIFGKIFKIIFLWPSEKQKLSRLYLPAPSANLLILLN